MGSWDRAVADCAVAADYEIYMADIIVLMGSQGAGKGTQAKMLAEKFGLPIIATGDMLREVARSDRPLGLQVREIQASGQLVSDQILAEVVSHRTSQDDCSHGYILDGFPRTLPQAHLLDSIADEQGDRIVVIEIYVPRELLFKRLTGRQTCSECGAIYNIHFNPSKEKGICDLDGQPLFKRSDDNEESIAKRLALYDEKTLPLLDHYKESGHLHRVDGEGTPKGVFDRIAGLIEKKGQESAAEG